MAFPAPWPRLPPSIPLPLQTTIAAQREGVPTAEAGLAVGG